MKNTLITKKLNTIKLMNARIDQNMQDGDINSALVNTTYLNNLESEYQALCDCADVIIIPTKTISTRAAKIIAKAFNLNHLTITNQQARELLAKNNVLAMQSF